DTLSGGAGVNRFYGGPGNDLLIGGSGSNVFLFSVGSGIDAIRLSTNVPGGNSIAIGGAYDTYTPRLGCGWLVIRHGNRREAVDTIDDQAIAGAGNRVRLGESITPASLALTPSTDTLTIGVGSGGDAVRLSHFDPTKTNGSLVVDVVEFADGAQVHLSSLL